MRIYKRYKHRPEWHLDFRYKDKDGKIKRRIEVVGTSKRLAQEALHKYRALAAEGKFFPERKKERIGFAEMAELYWELHGKHQPSAHITRHHIDQFKAPFGHKMVDQISVPDVLNYLNAVKDRASASTANRHHAIFRAIINRAIEWEKFEGPNPAVKVKQFRVDNNRLRFLTKDEIERLLEACPPKLNPIVFCALMTGMRRGEIFNLAWENVDMEQNILYVLKTKSGKPREIPIAPQLAELLAELGPKRKGVVFEDARNTVRRCFLKTLEVAKIHGFRFHDLRHTFASIFIMRTNDLPTLQNILGHASPRMTQRYAHLSKGHLASEMQVFAAAMPQRGGDRGNVPRLADRGAVGHID